MKRRDLVVIAAAGLLGAAAAQAAGPSNFYWYDGGVRRELRLESTRVADFSGSQGSSVVQIKVSPTAVTAATLERSKDSDAAGANSRVSPMFHDEAGGDAPTRALPGGVVVTLRQSMDPEQARQFLAQRGLRPVRPIGGSGMWLIESPAGVASLTLANQLHESGDFQGATPNWWRPRVLK